MDPTPNSRIFGGTSGAFAGAVPGGTPAPDPTAAAQQALGVSQEQMALLKEALQQAARPRIAAQQPVVPGSMQPMSPTPPGYMQQRPWGAERFLYQLQSSISELASAKEQRDVAKAENLYNSLIPALDKYTRTDPVTGRPSLDPAFKNDPLINDIMTDKNLRLMSNALQVDWLNPKKTTAHQQGMINAQTAWAQKQRGRQGLDALIHSLIHKAYKGQPQMTPELQQQQMQEVAAKAPIAPGMADVKDIAEVARIGGEATKAELDQRKQDLAEARFDYQQFHNDQVMKNQNTMQTARLAAEQAMQNTRDLAAEQRQNRLFIQQTALTDKRLAAQMERETMIKPSQVNATLNNTLGQLQAAYQKAEKDVDRYSKEREDYQKQTQARGIWKRMTTPAPTLLVDDPTFQDAQDQLAALKAGIQYLTSNRTAIVSGKIDMDEAVQKAWGIVSGGGAAVVTPTPVTPAPGAGGQFSPDNPFAPQAGR